MSIPSTILRAGLPPLLVFLTSAVCVCQEQRRPVPADVAQELVATYGFYITQGLTVQGLAEKYPELGMELRRAQLEFDSAFKDSVNRIDEIMEAEDPAWKSRKAGLQDKTRGLIAGQLASATPETARAYADEVRRRAKGQLKSPYLETLLINNPFFLISPEQEFTKGFTRTFDSAVHTKLRGISLKIAYPASWAVRAGGGTNVVARFVSKNGRGPESVTLLASGPPGRRSARLTAAEAEEMLGPQSLKEMLPPAAKYISSTALKIDGQPGALVHYRLEARGPGPEGLTRGLMFVMLREGRMIFVDCAVVAAGEDPQAFERRFTVRLEPLFRLVANSLVIQDGRTR